MGIGELLAAKQKQLLEAQIKQRLLELTEFPGNSLLWAAVGPVWTATLARLAGFPTGGKDVAELLDEIASRGFTAKVAPAPELQRDTTGKARLTTGEDLYSAGEQAVREILETTPDIADRARQVRDCIAKIREGLRAAQREGAVLPDRIVKWLELAARIDKWPSVKETLLNRVDECLAGGSEAGALAWVEAAFPLEKALGEDIALGVKLAGLRVQLHQRRAGNERHLKRFLEREAQVQAFRDLLASPEGEWGLHYAGSGGVGKTMLVRHLESRAAPAAGVSTARVDFDYLNPEYPSTKPGLLLVQFAGELRLADTKGTAAGYFQSFFDKAKTLHERLGGQAGPAGVAPVDGTEFQTLLSMFASAVREIPGRVVLILDTCEELAKMKADGSPQGAVEVTFKVLAQLHTLVPTLRVVFCGRRPLASEGAGWQCVRPAEKESLPARKYLRLHEIRSFDADEARRYLLEREGCRAELVEPILPHCREQGYAALFSNSSRTLEARYSPFDLSLYATWVASEAGVTPDEVAATGLDQYVRTRIVGRVENRELAALIPAIVWVGLVDADAMTALAGQAADSTRAAQLLAEMQGQEWVADAAGGGFLVPPEMRRRLLEYYAKNDRPAYNTGRNAAADYLEQALPKIPVRDMQVVHLEAALEALQPEPERAARWWRAIDERILKDGAWEWVLAPTLRLLADEHWPPGVLNGKHIRAAIAATRTAALVQTDDVPSALEISRNMEADAPSFPDEMEGVRLAAIAKALRAEPEEEAPDEMTEELGAAILTGLEWALAQEEPLTQEHAKGCIELMDDFDEGRVSLEQQAFALVLGGQLFEAYTGLREGDGSDWPKRCFQAAFGVAARFEFEKAERRWRFWKAPQDAASRLRLEFLRWAWPGKASPGQLEWWLKSPERINCVDADRLAGAVLTILGSQRAPALAEKAVSTLLTDSRRTFATEERLLPVHYYFPPYFAVAAEEMAYSGRVEEALAMLRQQASGSEAAGAAFHTTLDVDRVLTRIAGRFRLGDEGWLPSESLEYGGELQDRAMVAAQQALCGNPPDIRNDDLDSAAKMHARWSTCIAADRQAAVQLLAWAGNAFAILPADPVTFEEMSCRLDLIEANEVAERFGLPPAGRRLGLPRKTKRPVAPEAAFEIALRMWSLGIDRQPSTWLVERIGARRAAAIALDLGELLALRVPQRAVPMLRFARQALRKSGDPIRSAMASACLALACARAGRTEDLDAEVGILKALFGKRRNELVNPEMWRVVEATVTKPEAYPGVEVHPSWMRPWLMRIAMSVALSRDGGMAGRYCDNVRQVWMRVARRLPPEGMVEEPKAPEAAPPAAAPATTAGTVTDRVGTPVVSIECLDRGSRMASRIHMRLTAGTVTHEVLTTPPTDPYLPAPVVPFRNTDLVVVDPYAAWVCWEAAFDPTGESMISRRTRNEKLPVPDLMNWDKISYHTLTMHHVGADLGGSAFGKTRQWRYSTELERLSKEGAEPATVQVLHVVSDVVDTSGGARLSFQSEREEQRGRVIRADELTKLLPDVRLYVLQLPVGLNDGKRDGVCREKAALLRAFAAQLQLASEQIVITLPGLRFREGQDVLEAIMEGVEKREPTAAVSIFGELKRVRAHLFETLSPDEAEAGFDICYFG